MLPQSSSTPPCKDVALLFICTVEINSNPSDQIIYAENKKDVDYRLRSKVHRDYRVITFRIASRGL